MREWTIRVLLTSALLFLVSPMANSATIDFDSLPQGSPVTTIEGVTFTTNIVGYDLAVSDLFDTTSGDNYLGVADGGFEVFLPGDLVTLEFTSPVNTVSVNFISSPVTPGGVFMIDTPEGAAYSDSTPDAILGDLE